MNIPMEATTERTPCIAEGLSYAAYEAWATETLLRPDDTRYYRGKVIEESEEFLAADDPDNIVEEAGDLIWTLAAGRKLAVDTMGFREPQPDYFAASFASIEQAWVFDDLDQTELDDWITNSVHLFQRKLKLAVWVKDTSVGTKREFVVDVLDELMPRLVAAVAVSTTRRTNRTLNDILACNIEKLSARIATGTLDKSLR